MDDIHRNLGLALKYLKVYWIETKNLNTRKYFKCLITKKKIIHFMVNKIFCKMLKLIARKDEHFTFVYIYVDKCDKFYSHLLNKITCRYS